MPGVRQKLGDFAAGIAFEATTAIGVLITFGVLQQKLDSAGYGRYTAIVGITGIVALTLGAWAPQWLLEAVLRKNRKPGIASNEALGALLGLLAVGIFIAIGLGAAMLDVGPLLLIAVAVGDAAFVGFSALIPAVVQVHRDYVTGARLRFPPIVVKPLVLLVLIALGAFSLSRYVVVVMIAQLLVCVGLWVAAQRMTGHRLRPVMPTRRIIRDGLPYSATLFTWALQEDFDKTLLVSMRTSSVGKGAAEAEAGVYAAGYRVVQMGMMPIKALVSATHHRFLNPDRETPAATHARRALKLGLVCLGYAAVAAVGLWVFGKELTRLFGDEFLESITPMRALLGLIAMRALTWFPFNVLMGLGWHRPRMAVLAASSAGNLITNLALIPSYSWKGAVFATYVAEVIFMVGSWGCVIHAIRQERNGEHFGIRVIDGRSLLDRLMNNTYQSTSDRK